MNAESMLDGRQLEVVSVELEANLQFLENLTLRCLNKWQAKPSKDRSGVRQLLIWLVEAYIRRFNKKPPKSKNETNPVYGFFNGVVANAIGEQIGSELYIGLLTDKASDFDAYLAMWGK